VAFYQDPPRLSNQFTSDRVLRRYLQRTLPREMLEAITPALVDMGELTGGPLYEQFVREWDDEPRLVAWDPWGKRIDHIEHTALWKRAAQIAAEKGVLATAYERAHGARSRVHQFALAYIFDVSSAVYSCPLAMADGAARTLLAHRNQRLIERAVPRLTSRDPTRVWTSGQWMTERTGGSDVGRSETRAVRTEDGTYRLYGTKWFTSAATSEMALTLARPEGNPDGGKGLALFYVEVRNDDGTMNGIAVNRLKQKLGTRMLPTAELLLEGTRAELVAGPGDGVKSISPMLNVTRLWNSIGAISGMRRCLALSRDYASRRVQFGAALADKPLHADTLAGLAAEFEGAFLLTFRCVELLGRDECGELDEHEARLLRVLTPLTKLSTAKQCVAVASETVESFGGAGYVEDTGIPKLLRDAQVLPIWEGTTNVLSLDVLRTMTDSRVFDALANEAAERVARATDPSLQLAKTHVLDAVTHAREWLERRDEAGARRFALTMARAMQLALLVDHAQWARTEADDERTLLAARRFASHGVDAIRDDLSVDETRALGIDA
jgi:alkylation response protein AidB-like acyl-CoA dehydrogenase